ncbi:methyltransferase domain-containing protein [Ruegeria marina]|uniref:Methyltransferase domain-containing protein n=1 Tax=Ruegeria marina TaxID=639004 RepID=A0A1G6SIQ1_9RHOB|nr:methyltransferase domain-containing protein [Ruegeria marina]SDD16027.1 Methyltransferase domain-containing protein [Ruegeria marina]
MLKFGHDTARVLEDAYQGADITRRRRASFDTLAPAPGERLLDLGCGNGLLTLDLARAVGDSGHVLGLDPSPDMLDLARARCAGRGNVGFEQGRAETLPFADASLDGAVSLQVFEYFDDMRPPLCELFRVLKPGGRLVIGDMHWDTLTWHSDEPARMAEMCRIWDRHVACRDVPARLPAVLTEVGFRLFAVTPVPFSDTQLRPDGLAAMMIRLMTGYAVQTGAMTDADAGAWAKEQRDLARDGRFFFSLTHFVCHAQKP